MSVRNALSGSGTGGIIIWGGGLVFLLVMSRKLEGVHVSFLRHMTGQKVKRQKDGTWRGETEAKVLKEAVTQTLGTYIDKLQATVA